VIPKIVPKNPEIPILHDYNTAPNQTFWDKFPKNNLPSSPTTKINVDLFEQKIHDKKNSLSPNVWARAQKSVSYLRYGGPAFQKTYLPACVVKNSKAAHENGAEVTDCIASWIKKGFVSGPFDSPPLENFRVNSLLAVPQPGKVRVCLNVSLPEGKSFNDNIGKYDLEKMRMSSARSFSYSILESGPRSCMSKFDCVDAYKNVPARQADLRLQGFAWFGK